jgi:NADH-quinone oxidoreductase subunit E
MTTTVVDGIQVFSAVQAAIEKHGLGRDEIIPLLMDVNDTLGFLPVEALGHISKATKIPISYIQSVASFYSMLNTKPRGKHVIKFCENAPCHVMGGAQVWHALLDAIGIREGETSADGMWTLATTSCLGACGVGPVILIDDDLYGNLTAAMLPEILGRYH